MIGIISSYGESSIHGGVINKFSNTGIYLRNNAWTIEDMKIVRNGGTGIDATGARFIEIRDSLIALNGGYGISVGDSTKIRNSFVSNNGSIAVICKVDCDIEGTTVEGNALYGIDATSGIMIGNTISGFQYYGIVDNERSDVGLSNNMLIDNTTVGGAKQIYNGVELHPNSCVGSHPF